MVFTASRCVQTRLVRAIIKHFLFLIACSTLYQGNPQLTTQQMVLCGPEDSHFSNALEAVEKIFQYHEEAFPPNTLNGYKSSFASQHLALHAGARILSLNEDNSLPNIDIPDDVDPEYILRNLQSTNQYNYTADNQVQFDELISNEEGYVICCRYNAKINYELYYRTFQRSHINPAVFRQGHNVQISVVFKSMEKGKYRNFYIHLDTVLLQSRTGAQVSIVTFCTIVVF